MPISNTTAKPIMPILPGDRFIFASRAVVAVAIRTLPFYLASGIGLEITGQFGELYGRTVTRLLTASDSPGLRVSFSALKSRPLNDGSFEVKDSAIPEILSLSGDY